jgi:hypothetical protein
MSESDSDDASSPASLVFTRLWQEELGVIFDPSKREAFDIASTRLVTQFEELLQPQDFVGKDVSACLDAFWKRLCLHPRCIEFTSEMLMQSRALIALTNAVRCLSEQVTRLKEDLESRGWVMDMYGLRESSWILYEGAMHVATQGSAWPAATNAHMVALLEFFAKAVCVDLWGLKNPWASQNGFSLLTLSVGSSNALLTERLLANGLQPNDPGFIIGDFSTVGCVAPCLAVLLDAGLDLRRRDPGGVTAAMRICGPVSFQRPGDGPACSAVYRLIAERCPEVFLMRRAEGDNLSESMLDRALHYHPAEAVDVLLSTAGAMELLRYDSYTHANGWLIFPSALLRSLKRGRLPLVELLVKKYKVLERFEERYSEKEKARIAEELALVTLSSFKSIFHRDFSHRSKVVDRGAGRNADGLKIFDIVTSAGFRYDWNEDDENIVLKLLFERKALCMSEPEALTLLRRYKRAGMDASRFYKPDSDKDDNMRLSHKAAKLGLLSILQWSIEEGGCDVHEGLWCEDGGPASRIDETALSLAIQYQQPKAALLLLRKLGAAPSYHSGEFSDDLKSVLIPYDTYTDAEAVELIREMCRVDFQLLHFDHENRFYRRGRTVLSWNPLLDCLRSDKYPAWQTGAKRLLQHGAQESGMGPGDACSARRLL